MSFLLFLGNNMLDKCGTYLISNEGPSSEDVFTALRSFAMLYVEGNVKEEREYFGRLYGSLRGVGSDLIVYLTYSIEFVMYVCIHNNLFVYIC